MVIAAREDRKAILFDVPGAFLQAELPEGKLLLLQLSGEFVNIMCQINPEHTKNVIHGKNGKKTLYMKVVGALYGCIEAALAWYKLFKETLETDGFILNPHDKCIANKMINSEQCTIAWHVDDCLATHRDQHVLDDLANKLIHRFGDMTMT